ncbi:MAG: hypothetical protein ACRDGV_07420 [Candidatus Limnocylindria bacterium]
MNAARPQAAGILSSRGGPILAAGLVLAAVAVVAGVFLIVLPAIGPQPPAAGLPGRPAAPPLTRSDQLIRAFFEAARDPDAAFAVEADGIVTIEGLPESFEPALVAASFRLDGADMAGDLEISQGEAPALAISMIRVGGDVYAREPGSPEYRAVRVPLRPLHPVNPFARISTVGEIRHVDSITETGHGREELHRLRVTKWLGGNDYDDLLINIAILEQESSMDIWVTDAGIPRRAELVVTVIASDGVATATIASEVSYLFDEWGEIEPIEPPA